MVDDGECALADNFQIRGRRRTRCSNRELPQGIRAMARVRTHPSQLLQAELEVRGLSANQLALALRVPANRVTATLRGERSITAETAVRLGRYFGTGPLLWMNLQSAHDVSVIEAETGREIERNIPEAVS